jgi:NTE family protein
MSKANAFKTLYLLFCILIFHLACAGENPKRPKIGLALSGGGAKGLIHIGILQAIDSAGLKIDCVTGTSMGSIMGAMYAAGYSGDTVEALCRTMDWNFLFSQKPPLSAIGIEEKKEYGKYAVEIPLVKGKFILGKGIIEGQELWLKFAEVFEPVYNVKDFSKLSIPFRCIGTDLETGNAVSLDHGNIITCIRASMAIPGVFTPVEYEGKTLVDGGIVNNFPVLDAKEMGADIVIGVNLNPGLEKAEDLTSTLDILLQLAFFKDATYFEKHYAACDIYIPPDIQHYTAGSFAASDSLIEIGKKYGRMFYPMLKHLADSLNALYPDSEPFVKNRLPATKKITITNYSVHGLEKTNEKFFFGMAELRDSNSYSFGHVAESIRKIYGTRYYKKINYDFVPDSSGETEMRFAVEENPFTYIKLGLQYSTFNSGGIVLNISSRDLLFSESNAIATVLLGQNPRFYGAYYKYLGRKRKFGANFSYYKENQDYPIYQDFRLYQTLRSNNSFYDLRLQYTLNRKMYVGISQQFNRLSIKTKESPEFIYNGSNTYWESYLSFVMNSTDKKYFATTGWNVYAEAGYTYGHSPDFTSSFNDVEVNSDSLNENYEDHVRLVLKVDHFTPLSKKFVFIQKLALAYLITDNPYVANLFPVGGTHEVINNQVLFKGLNEAEIKTGSIATLDLELQYQLSKSLYLKGAFNAGFYNFHNIDFNALTNDNLLTGYGITVGYDSALGPIEMTVMYCDQDGMVRSNLNLGYQF